MSSSSPEKLSRDAANTNLERQGPATPPSKAGRNVAQPGPYPEGTLGAIMVKRLGVTDAEAEKRLLQACLGAGLNHQARIFAPFASKAYNYCALTIRDVGFSRSVDDVIEALEYWEERRPATLQGWIARRVRLKKSKIIDFAAQYLE